MRDKGVIIHIGHFGSGKTELSLNLALRHANEGGSVLLVDLDIVNPFFRSGEQRTMLEAAGVKVVVPLFVNTTVDVPALPAEVLTAFNGQNDCSILDVGGDPSGATALGRYHGELERVRPHVRCVVNACRPFTATARGIADMAREMEGRGRIRIDTLVNNTNLSGETTADTVLAGETVVQEAARLLGIPVEFSMARRDISADVQARGTLPVLPVDLYIRPVWLARG